MISGLVAIIGRPNVGKSTLFNRLTRSRKAIISPRPGVTRDRLFGTVYLDEENTSGFTLVDTGGFEHKDFNFQPFADNIVWQQSLKAIEKADLILFVLDGLAGKHPHDVFLFNELRKSNKPFLVLVNKIDGDERKALSFEFYSLCTDVICVSAAHNKGIRELISQVSTKLSELPSLTRGKDKLQCPNIAIIGRPNAGKSSILNRLLGEDRALVSDIAGTTRDAINIPITYNKKTYCLIDTAGIRRKTKIEDDLESLSVMQSLSAISEADVVILVIDAMNGLCDQDTRLLHLAVDRFKPVLLVVNKWDLIPEKTSNSMRDYMATLRSKQMRDMTYIPMLFTSCLQNVRVSQIMEMTEELLVQSKQKIPTPLLNQCLAKSVATHAPHIISSSSKRIKFYFASQAKGNHPIIVLKCNVSSDITTAYRRYLTNFFRRELGLGQVPVELVLRGKGDLKPKDAARQAIVSH